MRFQTKIKQTDRFRPAANYYQKNGYYIDAPEESPEWKEFWREQRRRSIEGYEVNGRRITGYHYFYLNFTRIPIIKTKQVDGREITIREEDFPRFWDGDYNYFWALDIARNGISKEAYEELDLGIDITDLDGGKHMVVLKARGKGFSWKAASMMARNFHLKRNSKNFAMAYEKEYLKNDGLLSKTSAVISFNDQNTAWMQPKLKDSALAIRSGYKEKVNNEYVEKGTNNSIIGVSLKDDPDRARGKRGELIFFEEAGKFPGLQKAWSAGRQSVEQGKYTFGTMIAYGTGGTDDADYRDLKKMFNNPESHNALPMRNIWDEGAENTNCCFFFPAEVNFEGFMDEDGNSDTEGAKQHIEEERELKRESDDDEKSLEQYISELPFTPQEATLQTGNNIFPTDELNERYNEIKSKDLLNSASSGILYESEGEIKFKPKPDRNPIMQFPTPTGIDRRGAVVIKETPYRNDAAKVPDNLYFICHDPYAHDGSPEGSSLGAAYVIKRTNNFSHTYNQCIVASYVGRPERQNDYNRVMFDLARYYNAKIAFENDRGNVIEYARTNQLLHYLLKEPGVDQKKERSGRRTRRDYGISMNSANRIEQGNMYLKDWLTKQVPGYSGTSKRLLNTIVDTALIQEFLNHNPKGNFDRISALRIAQFYLKDLREKGVKAEEESSYSDKEFFKKELFK